jgi:Mn-dependent DtxR family transcriptional regulator
MMTALCARGLVTQERYGAVSLTEEGRAIAARYAEDYRTIFGFFSQNFSLPPEGAKSAAIALLAGTGGEFIGSICEKMRGNPKRLAEQGS